MICFNLIIIYYLNSTTVNAYLLKLIPQLILYLTPVIMIFLTKI